MERFFLRCCPLVLLVGAFACSLFSAPETAHEPVFVYLQADITDHINTDITEDRLRHILPLVEKLRKEHPEAHVSATMMFSGAVADALDERNGRTHILDFVKQYVQRAIIEVGYDGADEPTYATRRMLDLSGVKTLDGRWKARATAADDMLTQGRDPITGSVVTGKDGGLKRMQEVLGSASYVTGLAALMNVGAKVPSGPAAAQTKAASLSPNPMMAPPPVPTIVPEIGADTETVYELRRYNKSAILPGLPEDNPAMIPGFGGGEEGFMELMSPSANTSPEVYWQDNVLRLSEVSNTSEAAAEAQGDYHTLTTDELKDDLKGLNRARLHVVRVELADERYYLQHKFTKDDEYALKYAYGHPASPKLPADARLNSADIEAAYAKEAEALEWLTGEFFSSNAGSRFVSNADLHALAAPSTGYGLSVAELRDGVTEFMKKWGNDTFPPPFVQTQNHYLSLADAFQVLTDAFAALDKTGRLPESVQVVPVYGPFYTPNNHGPNVGDVTVASIVQAATGIAGKLHDSSDGSTPKNYISTVISVGDIKMNPAQFLRLMATALSNPSLDTKVRVRMTYMYPGQATLVPKTRLMSEMGASWTVKPAQLQLGAASQTAQK